MWLWCIVIGSLGLLVSLFTKLATLGFKGADDHGHAQRKVVPEASLKEEAPKEDV